MKDKNNPLAGVQLLRAAAHWSGDRPEYMNDNKSATQIIKEYKYAQDVEYIRNNT